MAVLIIVIVFFTVGIYLVKKGVFKRRGADIQVTNDVRNNAPSLPVKNLQYAIKMFDTRFSIYQNEEDKRKASVNKISDDVQQYINEMVSLFYRRGEDYSIDFVDMNFVVMVVIKHWVTDELD